MDIEALVAIVALFIGLPWIVLHYMTRWKTAATLTRDDEALLEELYQLARRLDARMETVERIVAADHPDYVAQVRVAQVRPELRPAPFSTDHEGDRNRLHEIEQLLSAKGGKRP